MVLYKCDRCGKEFNHKGNFIAHLNRKKYCESKIKDIPIEKIKLKYNLNNLNNINKNNIINITKERISMFKLW